jgi:hypothetical protein
VVMTHNIPTNTKMMVCLVSIYCLNKGHYKVDPRRNVNFNVVPLGWVYAVVSTALGCCIFGRTPCEFGQLAHTDNRSVFICIGRLHTGYLV